MLESLRLGAAFRVSRNIVGGITGLLFSLGNIFRIPFSGMGPAITMGSIGLSFFLLKLRENYHLNPLSIDTSDYKQQHIRSYAIIARELLKKKPQRTPHTQREPVELQRVVIPDDKPKFPGPCGQTSEKGAGQHNPSSGLQAPSPHASGEGKNEEVLLEECQHSSEPEQTPDETDISLSQLEEILANLIKDKDQWSDIVSKYLYCTAAFLSQVGSHFMECLLIRGYDNPDLFTLNELSADNVFIGILALISLYNGCQAFKENQLAYEQKNIDDACNAFRAQFS